MLSCMFFPTKDLQLRCRLSNTQKQSLSKDLIAFSKYLPTEFQRKFYNGFDDVKIFKGTQYRTLLLYAGPYLFQSYFLPEVYSHFLLLSFGIYCLASEKYHRIYYSQASACLLKFVQLFPTIYDMRLMSYNVHVCSHLAEYVLQYGPLDNFSSFPFENFLGILKRRIKPSSNVFEQSLRHLDEVRSVLMEKNFDNSEFSFSAKAPDNCAMLNDGEIVVITSVDDTKKTVSGSVLKFSRNLYDDPYESKHIRLGFYSKSRLLLKNVVPSCKCILIPKEREFLVIPLV